MTRWQRTGHRRWLLVATAALFTAPAYLAGCATGTGDDTGTSSGVTEDSGPSLSPSPSGTATNGNGYDASSKPGTSTDSGTGTGPGAGGMDASPPGQPSSDASPPATTMPGQCDSNNPKYILELFTTMDAGACPCSASDCCFSGLVCLPM